ncbi:PREPILIN PEPTIDASE TRANSMEMBRANE PROTEIN [Cupriavidus taiwanensis]|uniref:PREPILIN PEPTIDASE TRANSMEMBRANE PROTEIN n=1 Tax=Cupriavidus taiwanensis TaxID=164546 RepID=A0A9Q7UMQ0_9BURK|nr:prepilin peptidase [Cupriavidus taiwanensis]SPD63749.1 PREPILIN PEPTIDASE TRANSMEMBRANE PROTEIN [Cupriavidus taiwanensis]
MQSATLATLVGPITIGIVTTAAAIDLDRRRIPNWLTFGAWLAALPMQAAIQGMTTGSLAWLYGWLAGLAILLPFYLLRGMAAGDVKLMAAVGAWLGAGMVPKIALATWLIGGVWALTLLLFTGQARATLSRVGHMLLSMAVHHRTAPTQAQARTSAGSLPYGVAIAAGTLAMLFAGT